MVYDPTITYLALHPDDWAKLQAVPRTSDDPLSKLTVIVDDRVEPGTGLAAECAADIYRVLGGLRGGK